MGTRTIMRQMSEPRTDIVYYCCCFGVSVCFGIRWEISVMVVGEWVSEWVGWSKQVCRVCCARSNDDYARYTPWGLGLVGAGLRSQYSHACHLSLIPSHPRQANLCRGRELSVSSLLHTDQHFYCSAEVIVNLVVYDRTMYVWEFNIFSQYNSVKRPRYRIGVGSNTSILLHFTKMVRVNLRAPRAADEQNRDKLLEFETRET